MLYSRCHLYFFSLTLPIDARHTAHLLKFLLSDCSSKSVIHTGPGHGFHHPMLAIPGLSVLLLFSQTLLTFKFLSIVSRCILIVLTCRFFISVKKCFLIKRINLRCPTCILGSKSVKSILFTKFSVCFLSAIQKLLSNLIQHLAVHRSLLHRYEPSQHFQHRKQISYRHRYVLCIEPSLPFQLHFSQESCLQQYLPES